MFNKPCVKEFDLPAFSTCREVGNTKKDTIRFLAKYLYARDAGLQYDELNTGLDFQSKSIIDLYIEEATTIYMLVNYVY